MPNDLSYEVIAATPIPFDFSRGYLDRWHVPLRLTKSEIENQEYLPIYNFLYPLGDRFVVPKDFRSRLNNTTIVNVEDRHYLALTGCGMDYSWEICETYLNLAYLPPAHFADLPAIAGHGTSLRDNRIVQGCVESLDALVRRYTRAANSLKQTYLAAD